MSNERKTGSVKTAPKTAGGANAGLVARSMAHRLLGLVLRRGQNFGDALAALPELGKLEERDRAFVRLLVLLTLRRLGQIDALLAQHVQMKTTPGPVVDVLRLTASQLLWLKTPPHAAVDTAVMLTEQLMQPRLKGLVNAVSRKLSTMDPPANDPQQILPGWLYQSWRDAYGMDALNAIAQMHMREPPLDITVKDDAAGWAEKFGAVVLPNGSLRLQEAGRIEDLPGYAEGAWWVQDAAAALPVRLLGDVRGKTIVDLGAAPGGKTAQLAAAGARVIAVERNPQRAAALRQNLARLKLTADVVVADAAVWRPDGIVDGVLLDAPCTATGTMRRHPEIAWLKDRLDVQKLATAQTAMLRHVAGWLPAGATLIYAVCSMQPEESERQIDMLLTQQPTLVRIPLTADEAGQWGVTATSTGDLRTLPSQWAIQGGMDGFFAARLRKHAEV